MTTDQPAAPATRLRQLIALLVLVALAAGAAVAINALHHDPAKPAPASSPGGCFFCPPTPSASPSPSARVMPSPAPSVTPTPSKPPPAKPSTAPPIPPGVRVTANPQGQRFLIYEVVSGDTLSGIAARYHVPVQEVYEWSKGNIGPNPDLIFPNDLVVVGVAP